MPNLKNLKLKRGRGRVPKPVKPTLIQASYYRAIANYVATAHLLVNARLKPILGELIARNEAIHTDAAMPPGRRVSLILEGAARSLNKTFTLERLEKMAAKAAAETSALNKANIFRQMKAALGVDLGTLTTPGLSKHVKQFTAENVSLIKSIGRDYFASVEKLILAGVRTGERHETLAKEIDERFEVADNHAALVARDQVLKLNGSLNRVRQTDLGIEKYTWRTVEDERVRSAHVDRDGTVYRWDDPPGDPDDPATGGHPGTAINCRCYPEPRVEALLKEAEGEDE